MVILAALAAVGLIGLPGFLNQEQAAKAQAVPRADRPGPDQPVRVKVVRPVREHLKVVSNPQPAHVAPYERTDLYARVHGYVEAFGQVQRADGSSRPIDIGDRVAKDQMLAKLAVPEMEQERLQKAARLDQAEAEFGQSKASLVAAEAMVEASRAKAKEAQSHVSRYRAEMAYRKSEHDRYASLFKERAVPKDLADEKFNQFQAAESAVAAAEAASATAQANVKVEEARLLKAEADVNSAKASLELARANLQHITILLSYAAVRAPYEGIIARRLVDTGAFVQSAEAGKSEPLFTMVRVDRLRIVAEIPQAEASRVRIGQTAALQVDAAGGRLLPGKVVRFADFLDSATRTMRTEIELDDQAATLRPGMFGSVTIEFVNIPDALMLPAGALVPGSTPAVLVVEEGKARRRDIELGLKESGRVQVNRGLTGKEQVIADGVAGVRDGQAVTILP
jgi:RND family efflux transporter MFP subunit